MRIRPSRLLGLPVALAALLAITIASSANAWNPGGDTLYSSFPGSSGMELAPDGNGGVSAGLHWNHDFYEYIRPYRVGGDGAPIGSWNPLTETTTFAADGVGGVYEMEFVHDQYGNTRLCHNTQTGAADPLFPGLEVYDASVGLGTPQGNAIAPDDSGGVFVVTNFDDARLYAWRIYADATLQGHWVPEGVVVRDNPTDYGIDHTTLTVARDGAGGLLVGAEVLNGGGPYGMWGFRLGPTGLRKWSKLATTASATGGPVLQLLAAGDHVFYLWANDLSSTQREIRLQSLALATGLVSIGWPATGLLVAQGRPESLQVRMGADGAGGAYVAWALSHTLQAVRINSDGTYATGWPGSGVALMDAAARVGVPIFGATGPWFAIAASPSELITCWSDNRLPASPNVRARWLLPDGTSDPSQPDTGRIVVRAAALTLGAMSDGAHGVYVGWEIPSQPYDATSVYVLGRVPYGGDVGVPPVTVPITAALRAWPNPAHDAIRLELARSADSPVHAELVDVAGHRVREVELAAGARAWTFDRLATLGSGVYFVRVTQDGVTRSTRVALIH